MTTAEALTAAGFPVGPSLSAQLGERYRTYPAQLRRLALQWPNELALALISATGASRHVTWAELNAEIKRIAPLLAERGAGPSSIVVVGLPNSVEHVVATFAAWQLGACVVTLDAQSPAPERERLLELAGPDLVIANWRDHAYPQVDSAALARTDVRPALPGLDVVPHPGRVLATSGSLGKPRLVVTPHPWLYDAEAATNAIAVALGLRPEQRVFVAGPLHFSWPWDMTYTSLAKGNSVVLLERYDDVLALDAIEQYQTNFLALVPVMMRRMAAVPGVEARDFSRVQTLCHTGAPCPPEVKRAWIELLGAGRVNEAYGATESFGLCVVRGDEWLTRPTTVGRPVACDVKILDESGDALPAGQVGEIFLRHHNTEVPGRYVGEPMPSRAGEGWHSVGDFGSVDEEGFLYLVDRSAELATAGSRG